MIFKYEFENLFVTSCEKLYFPKYVVYFKSSITDILKPNGT